MISTGTAARLAFTTAVVTMMLVSHGAKDTGRRHSRRSANVRMLEGRHSVVQRRFRPFIPSTTHGTMRPWLTRENHANRIRRAATRTRAPIRLTPVRSFSKAAYAVGETLDLLSIGRTSLYAAVKRGDLKCVKFGKKTLFYATDLASFLTRLRRLSEAGADCIGHAPGASKNFERS
jgi:hypothetical protein